MDVKINAPERLYLIALVIAMLAVWAWSVVARSRALARFGDARLIAVLKPSTHWIWQGLSILLMSAAMLFLVVALMDIRWGREDQEVPQRGIEVVFAIDVSQSMLAQDVAPNRLERAKQQIRDIIDELDGDRVALVAFAGTARQIVPLTNHYEEFQQALDTLDTNSIPVGGTNLGDAIHVAGKSFLDKTQGHRAILLITDGEDQEGRALRVAEQLASEQGVRIFTIGLGDIRQGARIPVDQGNGFLTHGGQQVWSKMDGKTLQEIASATHGTYIPVGTRQVNMADVYHKLIANVPQMELEMAAINTYIPRFNWFAVPALVLVLVEAWLPRGAKRRTSKGELN